MNKKTLIIMAHSNPSNSIFNQKIKKSLENEENIIYKDIKTLYSDYKFDIKKEQEDILSAQKIIFQFPLYWYTAPSILKQWVDDVFSVDFAFKYEENGSFKALNLVDKEFQMIVTLGGSKEEYEEFDISIKNCLHSYSTTALVLGMKEKNPYMFYGVDTIKYSDEQIENIMLDIKKNVLG